MKFTKIALLLTIFILLLGVMTSCRCEPSSETWHFHSYRGEMTFIGGLKMELGFSDASHAYPFAGASNSNIGISFTKDGKVVFTDKEGATHYGTYTYEHQGFNYTSFTITLDNGEIIKGDAMKGNGDPKLALTYKDVIYNFTNQNKRSNITIDDVVKQIVTGEIDTLKEVTVYKTESGYSVAFSEMISYPIKEDTAVFAMRINKDGSYDILDALIEGEALSTYNDDANYIVIYYIEK